MSKLTDVRIALEGNPNIVIVGVPERNYLPECNGCWSGTLCAVHAKSEKEGFVCV